MMNSKLPEHRLPSIPWAAVVGELLTLVCFGCLGLFLPLFSWLSWPESLTCWHFVAVVFGAGAIIIALLRRRPEAIKPAVVLAAYVGLPNLLVLSQLLGQINAVGIGRAVMTTYGVWLLGMLGQVMVVSSCLRRLAPKPTLAFTDVSSGEVGMQNAQRESVAQVDG